MANRYVRIGLLLAVASLALAGLAAVAGYLALEYRNAQWLAEAEAAYAAGDWPLAKSMYERYIPQEPGNTDLLFVSFPGGPNCPPVRNSG